MINSVTGNSVGVETTWVKRSKGQAKNNFFALLQEAVITLTQFTIFLPVIALGTLIFTTLSSVLLFIIKIFTNIGHDLFITLAISLIMFNFLLLFITILVLSIKIYYLSKDIKKDNVVLVKETYNL